MNHVLYCNSLCFLIKTFNALKRILGIIPKEHLSSLDSVEVFNTTDYICSHTASKPLKKTAKSSTSSFEIVESCDDCKLKKMKTFETGNVFNEGKYSFERVKYMFSELAFFEIEQLSTILEIVVLLYQEEGISEKVKHLIADCKTDISTESYISRFFQQIQEVNAVEINKDFYMHLWYYIKDVIFSKSVVFDLESSYN